MLAKLLNWWIKGSIFCVLFMIVVAFSGGTPLVDDFSSGVLNWVLSFAIAITPVGTIVGDAAW